MGVVLQAIAQTCSMLQSQTIIKDELCKIKFFIIAFDQFITMRIELSLNECDMIHPLLPYLSHQIIDHRCRGEHLDSACILHPHF